MYQPIQPPQKKVRLNPEVVPPNTPIKRVESAEYRYNWIGVGERVDRRIEFVFVPTTPTKHSDTLIVR